MPDFKLLIGPCQERLKELPEASVDLVVTSIPYKKADGWTEEFVQVLTVELYRVMKEGARVWFNFGQLKEDYARPFICHDILRNTFFPLQTIIWAKSIITEDNQQKGHYKPLPSTRILNYGWEFIYQFSKWNKPGELDRLAIGVPFSDKGNLTRGNRGINGDLHSPSDIWVINHIEEDCWFIPYGTTGKTSKKDHEYQYPLELVRRIIRLSNLPPGATVLDPCLGSGSTAKVANELGFSAIGIEIDESKVKYGR